jgi:hypothetical protein
VVITGNPIASLGPGVSDNDSYTGYYILTQADIDASSYHNTAVATGTAPDGETVDDSDEDSQLFNASPEISLEKTGRYIDNSPVNTFNAGDEISYQFIVTNTGNVTLTNVVVTDPLITVNGGPVGSLNPGTSDQTTFTGTYVLTQADIDNGTLTNTATVTGSFNGETATDDDDDVQTFIPVPSLSLEKTGTYSDANGDGIFSVGDQISYTFLVTNTGNVTLQVVTITDPLVTVNGQPITSLDPGSSDNTSFTATYTLTQADIDAGTFTNTATATARYRDEEYEASDSDTQNFPSDQVI